MALVTAAFFFCYTLNQWLFLLFNMDLLAVSIWTSPAGIVSNILQFLNFSINPFIYCLQYDQFQKALKKMFCDRCFKIEDSITSSTGSSSKTPSNTTTSRGTAAQGTTNLRVSHI